MVETRQESVEVSESIGRVSCIINKTPRPIALMILAHGAGAPMTHPFMKAMAIELAERRVMVVRYNFPYMEAKKNRPDVPAVAHQTVKAVSDWAHKKYSKIPLLLAGKSFGGRMSSQYIAKEAPDFVSGICFYGFPLHAPGKPSIDRADHLKEVQVPMLFHQGTRDALADFGLIQQVTGKLPETTLVSYEGADHSFKKGKQVFIDELVQGTIEWINTVI